MQKHAVILDFGSLTPSDLDCSALFALPFTWHTHEHTFADQTAERLKGCAVALTNKIVIDRSMMEANPQLELILIMATGTNNIDLVAASELGIRVCNVADYSTESVVQHTFALMLALQTKLQQYAAAVQDGQWKDRPFLTLTDFPVHEVFGKTLGIIGFGAIGRRVKTIAEAFGMTVQVAESIVPGAEAVDGRIPLNQLLAEADIVTVHSPLSSHSRNLLDADRIALMKPSALLLNTGRGGIIDEDALLSALLAGRLGGAGLDVLAQEPPADDHPLITGNLPNVIITPHSAWSSRQARQNLVNQMVTILQGLDQPVLVNRVV